MTLQALGSFTAALQSDAGHVDSLIACAGLYRSCNLLAEAVEALQRAVAAQPDRSDVQSQLAAGLTDLGALSGPLSCWLPMHSLHGLSVHVTPLGEYALDEGGKCFESYSK